jgi:antitoxin ChpS
MLHDKMPHVILKLNFSGEHVASNPAKAGGSVALTVPAAMLEALRLAAGSTVDLFVNDGQLVVNPKPRPRYTLKDLLAQCDSSAEISAEDRQWLDSPPVGRELL